MTPPAPLQGACLCGSVRYSFSGTCSMMAHCHCSLCRKQHGSAFATLLGAPLMGFKWLSGKARIGAYRSSEKGMRCFCRTCGSVMPALMPDMDLAVVPAGNLQGDPGLRPQCHVFVASKASWYEITDTLPQHEEYPPEVDVGAVSSIARESAEDVTVGSCLCNQVAFEIRGPARFMRHCHCSRCRRAYGAAHATNVFYGLEDFHYTRGAEHVQEYRVSGAQYFSTTFCRHCGGATARLSPPRGLAIVPAGILDTDPGIRPMGHIYVGSKADWFDISDGLPQFETSAPA